MEGKKRREIISTIDDQLMSVIERLQVTEVTPSFQEAMVDIIQDLDEIRIELLSLLEEKEK